MDMKKIFTFILLAISTLAMAQAYPGYPGILQAPAATGITTDVITYGLVTTSGVAQGRNYYLLENSTLGSGATYTVYAKESTGTLLFTNISDIVTTTSGGRIQSVTVDWGSGNLSGISSIQIYGKTSEYPNNGVDEWKNKGTLLAEIIYPATTATNLDTKKCTYVMITGGSEPSINSISFNWQEVNTRNITALPSANGEITTSTTTSEPGEKVSVTFIGNSERSGSYELHSYTIDGATTVLTEAEYTNKKTVSFTMPSHDVTISAEFGEQPERVDNSVTASGAQVAGKTIRLTSGNSYTINFTADYFNGFRTHGPYRGNIATAVAGETIATPTEATYSTETGNGSLTLTAYNQGTAKLTFTTTQTNDYEATTITYNIVVVPREVMLITEYNGKMYAVANDLDIAGKLAAQEVLYLNGTAYVPSDATHNQAQLTWKVCTKKDGTYTIQNSKNQYLGYSPSSPATMTLDATTVYNWYKYKDNGKDRFFNNNNEIIYYNTIEKFASYAYDKWADNTAYSHGAYEINDFATATATARTIRTDLTPGAFSTLCLPYSFIAEDELSIYNIDNYEDNGSSYKFYFCRLDTGEITTAGQPYIIKSPKATAKVYQIGEENAPAGNYRGLHGTMSNLTWSSVWGTGNYTLGNVLVINAAGEIKYANDNGGVYANRAYILLSEIPTESDCTDSPSGAPRRVSLSTEVQQTPTAVDQLQSADAINWNEPVYNVMGQRVARGTTGVLVQNGQKFIAL